MSQSNVGYFAHDVSTHFEDTGALEGGPALIGRYQKYNSFGGPLSTPPVFTQPASEILPETLVGKDFESMTSKEQSTFRVVRAVSEVECIGFFDCINAYDSALVSIGPCHWTLGLVKRTRAGGQVYDGELCGTFAYVAVASTEAFASYIGDFGVKVRDDWRDDAGTPNGARLFDRSLKKYVSWLMFENDDGTFSAASTDEREGNYFKSWHWIYRITAAMRGSVGFRRAFWDVARVRLRDIAPLTLDVAGTRRQIQDVFTSEKARAFLHRWHVYRPAHIANGDAGSHVRRFVDRAMEIHRSGWEKDPSTWTDAHEAALVQAIRDEAKSIGGDIQNTVSYVNKWPQWATGSNPRGFQLADGLRPLSEGRHSFKFDDSGLPPTP